MSPTASPAKARCPECDARIFFERTPDIGQLLACPECGTSLEVIRTSPVELDWAYEEGESKGGGGRDEGLFDDVPDSDFGSDRDEEYGGGYDDEEQQSGW